MSSPGGDSRIAAGLADTIRALRRELSDAMVEGKDESLHFRINRVGLEATVAITREGSGDAGVRFGVVSFGAKGSLSNEATHHLSLELSPLTMDGEGKATPAEVKEHVPEEPK